MAINLDDRYPGRANSKTTNYPQGSFKNRTSPSSKDGTYLEQDWANDFAGFFQALMRDAGLTANGNVDTALASQYFDALMLSVANRFPQALTFAEIDALTQDEGPIICTDMGGDLYVWVSTSYFTGYRNPRSGLWYGGASDAPEAWELLANGGTWSTSNPKHARVIARYREWGRTVASGSWTKGWNHIADLGGGAWKAPDLRDVFQRMSGTDADTANPMGVGAYQADALQNITGSVSAVVRTQISAAVGALASTPNANHSTANIGTNQNVFDLSFDASRVARTSTETRAAATRIAPVILV